MIRRVAALVLSSALVFSAAACSSPAPKDDGTATGKALATALSTHTVGSLAFDVPSTQVQTQLTAFSKGIDPVWPTVKAGAVTLGENDTAKVVLNYSWAIPKVTKPWTYQTTAEMKRDGGGWKISWKPSMVQSQLDAGDTLKITTVYGRRGEIMDSANMAIVKDRPVQVLGINKDGLTDAEAQASAKALATIVGIDPAGYQAKVKAYGAVAFVDAITLRQDAAQSLDQNALKGIKGFLEQAGALPLAPSRTFAQAILGGVHEATAEDIEKSKGQVVAGQNIGTGGLQASFDSQLAGTPAVTVTAVRSAAPTLSNAATDAPTGAASDSPNPDASAAATDAAQAKDIELFQQAPADGSNVKTTLVQKMQSDAENALANVKTPSSVVVIKPSTGAILAAANGPDSNGYNTAFLGQYAPGSTFKIATALGLFREGMTPTSTLSCSPEFTADGKKFYNAPGYAADATGNIPMTVAIAHSCNTAFVSEYQKLSQAKLADAAHALGIGMSNDLGLAAFTGSIPADSAGTEHAASMIGQGKVEVSPLDMANLMASVVKGSVSTAVLVQGHDGKAKPVSSPALTTKEAEGLRTMMRASVTDGYLELLNDLPGAPAIGKTGTAEFGTATPPHTHSWVIAAQGDLAVAVFVEDGDLGAVTAGPIAKQMLLDAGSK